MDRVARGSLREGGTDEGAHSFCIPQTEPGGFRWPLAILAVTPSTLPRILARAGLHLGVSTVGLILREKPVPPPTAAESCPPKNRVVTSKYPNHLWQTDLTTVPIGPGFWTSWLPFSLPQCWPFCWWVVVAMDHYSRQIMGTAIFGRQPASEAVRAFLGRVIHAANAKPKHLIIDKGPQFWCEGFKDWRRNKEIKPRFGTVGQHGSIAVIERLILTLKQNIAWLTLIPWRREAFRRQLGKLTSWYNTHRPHMFLDGRTPGEVYHRQRAVNRQPRFEPRPERPRRSPCASPITLVKGKPGVRLQLDVTFQGGQKRLPLVALQRAA